MRRGGVGAARDAAESGGTADEARQADGAPVPSPCTFSSGGRQRNHTVRSHRRGAREQTEASSTSRRERIAAAKLSELATEAPSWRGSSPPAAALGLLAVPVVRPDGPHDRSLRRRHQALRRPHRIETVSFPPRRAQGRPYPEVPPRLDRGRGRPLKKIGFAANRRLLGVRRLNHDCTVGVDVRDRLHRPALIYQATCYAELRTMRSQMRNSPSSTWWDESCVS